MHIRDCLSSHDIFLMWSSVLKHCLISVIGEQYFYQGDKDKVFIYLKNVYVFERKLNVFIVKVEWQMNSTYNQTTFLSGATGLTGSARAVMKCPLLLSAWLGHVSAAMEEHIYTQPMDQRGRMRPQ